MDTLATTPDSLRLCTDVLGKGIEQGKDEEDEEEAEAAEEEEAEEEEDEEEEHPELIACRPCGLVFAHVWGLKEHQIRGCRSTNLPPGDVREKTMG